MSDAAFVIIPIIFMVFAVLMFGFAMARRRQMMQARQEAIQQVTQMQNRHYAQPVPMQAAPVSVQAAVVAQPTMPTAVPVAVPLETTTAQPAAQVEVVATATDAAPATQSPAEGLRKLQQARPLVIVGGGPPS